MQFESLIAGEKPVLISFGATWCAPCQWLEPILQSLSQELEGKIDIHKIDIDQEPELSKTWHIRSVPTLILFRNGNPVWRYQGFDTAPRMKQIILDHLDDGSKKEKLAG